MGLSILKVARECEWMRRQIDEVKKGEKLKEGIRREKICYKGHRTLS